MFNDATALVSTTSPWSRSWRLLAGGHPGRVPSRRRQWCRGRTSARLVVTRLLALIEEACRDHDHPRGTVRGLPRRGGAPRQRRPRRPGARALPASRGPRGDHIAGLAARPLGVVVRRLPPHQPRVRGPRVRVVGPSRAPSPSPTDRDCRYGGHRHRGALPHRLDLPGGVAGRQGPQRRSRADRVAGDHGGGVVGMR